MLNPYTEKFYAWQRAESRKAAEVMVPYLLSIGQPKSVVDIGSGVGTWLGVFHKHGIEDILGVDGDYVKREMLEIPQQNFQPHDLATPLNLGRKFDMAISLEVAEHLPARSAKTFVDSLTRASDLVVFSAAVPLQAGVNHINEQWPTYWAELFDAAGYQVMDCIRPMFWDRSDVQWWYLQNMLLFVNTHSPTYHTEQMAELRSKYPTHMMNLVHPRSVDELTFGRAFWLFLTTSIKAVKQKLGLK